MAGIGFALRKIGSRQSFSALLGQYGAAGLISSGPWLLSILSIMAIGILTVNAENNPVQVTQFQVSVTYLFAVSLLLTAPLHLMFTRFVADRLFEDKSEVVLPNLVGAILVSTIVSGVFAFVVLAALFGQQTLQYKMLMAVSFVVLCDTWIVLVLLSGLKRYALILLVFALGYTVTVAAALALDGSGLEGLLAGFCIGQACLLFMLMAVMLHFYPGENLIAFGFLRRDQVFPSLAATGLLYMVGIWADKFLFWSNPLTSYAVIGPLRASLMYDLPIFLAYLAIVPGMAVFLMRMETDFAELYEIYYSAVRGGGTLNAIERTRGNMIEAVRQGIYEILKVQGLVLLIVMLVGGMALRALGISELYLPLLCVDTAAVGVQVILLSILNVLFYLDQKLLALSVCTVFVVVNIAATWLTQILGPPFYGYGFAAGVTVSAVFGLYALTRKMDGLTRETFMLQAVTRA